MSESGKVPTPRFLGAPVNFWSEPSFYEKNRCRRKWGKKLGVKKRIMIMIFIVATNVVVTHNAECQKIFLAKIRTFFSECHQHCKTGICFHWYVGDATSVSKWQCVSANIRPCLISTFLVAKKRTMFIISSKCCPEDDNCSWFFPPI